MLNNKKFVSLNVIVTSIMHTTDSFISSNWQIILIVRQVLCALVALCSLLHSLTARPSSNCAREERCSARRHCRCSPMLCILREYEACLFNVQNFLKDINSNLVIRTTKKSNRYHKCIEVLDVSDFKFVCGNQSLRLVERNLKLELGFIKYSI